MKRPLAGLPLYPLAVLFGLNAVDELDRTAFALLLPEVRRAFDLDLTGATALAAAVIPAGLIFGLPVAYLADRRRRVPIAVTGAAAWGVFSALTGLAPTIVLLALARIGAGLGRAVNDPVHGSLLSDYYPPGSRARVFGVHRAANTVGAFCGPLAAGLVAGAFGWRVPFVAFAVPTFLLLALALRLREPERTGAGLVPPGNFRQSMAAVWAVPTLRRIWASIPLLGSAAIALTFLLSLYYEEVFGVGVRLRGALQAFDAPFIILGLAVASPLIDRGLVADPARVVRRIGLAAASIGLLVAALAAAPTVWAAAAIAYAIVALAVVLVTGGVTVISMVAPAEVRATAFAFYGIFALFGVAGLPIVGMVGDMAGLRWGVATMAPIVFAGGLILSTAGRFVVADVRRLSGREGALNAGPSPESRATGEPPDRPVS